MSRLSRPAAPRRSASRRPGALALVGLLLSSAALVLPPPAGALPPVDAPTAVVAVAANASASVSWVAPANNGGSAITSYTVTTNGPNAPFPLVTGTALTVAVVTGLTNGSSYSFTVFAMNADGNGPVSASSNLIISGAPGAPTSVSGISDDASVQLSWNAPANNGGSPITSYRVTTTGPGAPGPITTGTAATSLIVGGLTNGSSYTFTVAATNINGTGPDSSASNPVTPRTVPHAPTAATATAGNASASLTWNAPADNGGANITSYTITTVGVGGPAPIVTGNAQTSRTVSGLTNGNSYTFTVAATNVVGTGADSSPSNAVIPQADLPGAPTGVAATPGDASATVTWNAPADNGGATISSYHIMTTGPGAPAPMDTGSAATSAIVGGLTNGSSYTFTVAATNSTGTGPDSSSSAPVTPRTVPNAPTGVTATAGNSQASLSWSAPANDGGATITSYTITTNGAGAPGPIVTGTAQTTRTITGLTNGNSYTFTVAATNVAGTGAGADSNAVTPRTVPGAPTNVLAAPANTSAVVSWTAPADNGGAAVVSYLVTTHGPAPVPAPFTVLAPATATSVGGLVNGRSYTFAVAATNVAGTGADSVESNAVVPLTVPGQPTGVTAEAGDGQFTVSWSPPADPGGSSISSYTVTVRSSGTLVTDVVVGGTTTSTTVTGLTNGTTYSVKVAAANNSGSGPASAPVQVTPFGIPVTKAGTASGYWMLESDGTVHPFGAARFLGDPRGQLGGAQAVDLEATPSGAGYWILDDAGHIFAYGDAASSYFGNVNPNILVAGERAASLSATPSGGGYWVFTTRGRVIAFGNARHFGDMAAVPLNGPVLDSVATPDGKGYYMVASDGGIFAFGTAVFVGSMGGIPLNAPVQSLVPDGDGDGYWLVASDGGVFAFHAPFRGSMGGVKLNQPVTGMVRYGDGYLMVATDGGIFNFSDKRFFGSLAATPPPHPITAVAVLES